MNILIAHHQEKVRSALAFLLSQEPNMQVMGSLSNLEEIVKILSSTRPDVVLLECDFLRKLLEEQIAEFQERFNSINVIVLCSGTEKKMIMPATGDYTFVDITEHPRRLITALRILELEREYE